MLIHPDDILGFQEVVAAMKVVAKQYGLPLREVIPSPNAEYATAKLGRCSSTGTIELTMRGKTNGQWDVDPMPLDRVFEVAGHELAHLKHMNHGAAFLELEAELVGAMRNRREDHTMKVLDRLVKLQKSKESEAALGNSAAAEAFAGMINKMLLEYELNPSDIDYARTADRDPVIEIKVNWKQHMRPTDNPKKFQPAKRRIAWQETLARVVSKAHLCTFLITAHSDDIWFVGTKSHASVAEYVYSTLVLSTFDMVNAETAAFKRKCKREGNPGLIAGFRDSWLSSFIHRVDERFQEARKAAVKEATADVPNGQCTALLRLDGALLKVNRYIEDKFAGKRSYLSAMDVQYGTNRYGREAGKKAADSIAIGRKGIENTVRPKMLKG